MQAAARLGLVLVLEAVAAGGALVLLLGLVHAVASPRERLKRRRCLGLADATSPRDRPRQAVGHTREQAALSAVSCMQYSTSLPALPTSPVPGASAVRICARM